MKLIKAPKVRKKLPPSLSSKELSMLLKQSRLSKRDRAVLLLLSGTGIRMGEAINLHFQDIKYGEAIVSGKTGQRKVPLPDMVRAELLEIRDGHGEDEPVFWGVHPVQPLKQAGLEGIVKKAFQNAGIEGVRASPHTLRHTFGRLWVAGNGDLVSLQRILGHTNIQQTQVYVSLAAEELQEKSNLYNPLLSIFNQSISSDDGRLPSNDGRIPAEDGRLPSNDGRIPAEDDRLPL